MAYAKEENRTVDIWKIFKDNVHIQKNVNTEKVFAMNLKIRFSEEGKDKVKTDVRLYCKDDVDMPNQIDFVVFNKETRALLEELNNKFDIPRKLLELEIYCSAMEATEMKAKFLPEHKGKL